jgi:hypothetical protein
MLVSHVLFVAFVVLGLLLIYLSKVKSWQWTRNPWFRLIHLLSITLVVLQSWLGMICPLTIWEMELRKMAGQTTYDGSFITHWMTQLLYYNAPPWVFVLLYTVFGALVLMSWFIVRPRPF